MVNHSPLCSGGLPNAFMQPSSQGHGRLQCTHTHTCNICQEETLHPPMLHTHTHTQTHTHTHTHTHLHTHTHTRTCTHTRALAHTHLHTHTHSHCPSFPFHLPHSSPWSLLHKGKLVCVCVCVSSE